MTASSEAAATTWVATTWDDLRAVELREAMTSDLAPRYADLREQRTRLFAAAEPGRASASRSGSEPPGRARGTVSP